MKKYNWDDGFNSFHDKKEVGKVFFEVNVGAGRPQRLYPETGIELRDCLKGLTKSPLNPALGDLLPPGIRH